MNVEQVEVLEKKMKRIKNNAILFQLFSLCIAYSIMHFRPPEFQKMGFFFSITALIFSRIISKLYINSGKELENYKSFSPAEISTRSREYGAIFFAAYPLWAMLSVLFLTSWINLPWTTINKLDREIAKSCCTKFLTLLFLTNH